MERASQDNKEQIKFEQKPNQLSKAERFTLSTFHHRKWQEPRLQYESKP